jgi:hypothetical protein
MMKQIGYGLLFGIGFSVALMVCPGLVNWVKGLF